MARVGVILSGCGVNDGAEIHESVIAMLALEEAGATLSYLAPNKQQTRVNDHSTGEDASESRNVLVESARIARGEITDLAKASIDDFDAVVLPGGFGAALNLCDFALKGADASVDPDVEKFLVAMNTAKKPIAAMCIAPTVLAKVFGSKGVKLTVGNAKEVADNLEKLGAKHIDCAVDDCIVDEENLIVTTPAYMLAQSVKDLYPGAKKMVAALLKLTK